MQIWNTPRAKAIKAFLAKALPKKKARRDCCTVRKQTKSLIHLNSKTTTGSYSTNENQETPVSTSPSNSPEDGLSEDQDLVVMNPGCLKSGDSNGITNEIGLAECELQL